MKRTTNHGVAKAWVKGTEAQSGNGNMSTGGQGLLYSYSTPIARIVEGVNGQAVYLITAHSYSVTTQGKHIGPAHRATGYSAHVVPFFGVGRIGRHGPDTLDMAEAHAGNLAYLHSQYSSGLDDMKRKRSLSDYDHERLSTLAARIANYVAAFGLTTTMPHLAADRQALAAHHEAKQARAAKRRAKGPSAVVLPFQRRA